MIYNNKFYMKKTGWILHFRHFLMTNWILIKIFTIILKLILEKLIILKIKRLNNLLMKKSWIILRVNKKQCSKNSFIKINTKQTIMIWM